MTATNAEVESHYTLTVDEYRDLQIEARDSGWEINRYRCTKGANTGKFKLATKYFFVGGLTLDEVRDFIRVVPAETAKASKLKTIEAWSAVRPQLTTSCERGRKSMPNSRGSAILLAPVRATRWICSTSTCCGKDSRISTRSRLDLS